LAIGENRSMASGTALADLWTMGRALRIADGPDEVHLRSIARREIARGHKNLGAAAFLTPPLETEGGTHS
jgi:acyl-CoA dehydrogenase